VLPLQQSAHSAQLALLLADEEAILTRKQNVRLFGANWLRPPGVAKTYQARMDELTEKREQAEVARREQVMADLQAAEEERRQQAEFQEQVRAEEEAAVVTGEGEIGGDGDGMVERDLDADVPDADALQDSEEEEDSDEDDEDSEEDAQSATEGEGDTTRFNDASLLESSLVGGDILNDGPTRRFLDAEDAELDGRAQDMRDLGFAPQPGDLGFGMEVRDLDDDIPEAGSYEHTDTEVEESTSEEEDEEDDDDVSMAEGDTETSFASVGQTGWEEGQDAVTSAGLRPPRRPPTPIEERRGSSARFRLSGASEMSETGGLLDSPVLSRSTTQGIAWRERMMRARRRRS
jgi:hypothetical protein